VRLVAELQRSGRCVASGWRWQNCKGRVAVLRMVGLCCCECLVCAAATIFICSRAAIYNSVNILLQLYCGFVTWYRSIWYVATIQERDLGRLMKRMDTAGRPHYEFCFPFWRGEHIYVLGYTGFTSSVPQFLDFKIQG
jgi:hypothetical protein